MGNFHHSLYLAQPRLWCSVIVKEFVGLKFLFTLTFCMLYMTAFLLAELDVLMIWHSLHIYGCCQRRGNEEVYPRLSIKCIWSLNPYSQFCMGGPELAVFFFSSSPNERIMLGFRKLLWGSGVLSRTGCCLHVDIAFHLPHAGLLLTAALSKATSIQ